MSSFTGSATDQTHPNETRSLETEQAQVDSHEIGSHEVELRLARATHALIAHAHRDPALAQTLRQLAQVLLEALPVDATASATTTAAKPIGVDHKQPAEIHNPEATNPEATNPDTTNRDTTTPADEQPVAVSELASATDISNLLTSFGSNPPQTVTTNNNTLAYHPQRIARHLRLKANACHWLEHHALTDDQDALDKRYALIQKAKADDCLLWMFNRDYINPQHPRLAEVATLLEITADAIILWDDAYNEPEGKSIAQLVATVQSALRVSVQAVNVQDNWFDSDQKAVYQELKYYGEREQHYLQHMRLNDAAEPTQHAYYRQQLDTLQQTVQDRRNADKQRQTQRNKLRFHVAKLLERPNNAPHEWQRVLASLEPFWQGDDDDPHLPPDIRVDVRPLLRLQNTPSLDDETRDWFETISAVFEDMAAEDADVDNKTLSRESAKSSSHPLHDTTISADVHRLAPYLEGRTVVIIGGDPKTRNSAVLEQHFNCRIDWIKTNAHQSIYSFQSNLIRDDVILVALLIRWSSHVFGEVKSMCDDHNKLFVRLPRGYSVNMFAHEVIGQVGDRLGM